MNLALRPAAVAALALAALSPLAGGRSAHAQTYQSVYVNSLSIGGASLTSSTSQLNAGSAGLGGMTFINGQSVVLSLFASASSSALGGVSGTLVRSLDINGMDFTSVATTINESASHNYYRNGNFFSGYSYYSNIGTGGFNATIPVGTLGSFTITSSGGSGNSNGSYAATYSGYQAVVTFQGNEVPPSNSIPEPGTLALVGFAALPMAGVVLRRRSRRA